MGRRKRKSDSRNEAAEPSRPWSAPRRPNKGLLAGAALLQLAWIGFLIAMIVRL